MRARILTCVIGLVATLGGLQAQTPTPAAPATAAPKLMAPPAATTTPATAAPTPAAAPVQGVVDGNCGKPAGGCNSCVTAQGPGCDAKKESAIKSKVKMLFIGQGCATPVGCGNIFTSRTFIFGSCNQFFNAGNDCGPCAKFGNCSGSGCTGCGGCSKHPCSGMSSYLNR